MNRIPLKYSTSFTYKGPLIHVYDSKMIFYYDYEDDEGHEFWTKISFDIVYFFKYTESEYIEISDYEFGLVEILNSDIIQAMTQIWSDAPKRNERDAFGKEVEQVRHYQLCFDDNGIYDILSKKMEIIEDMGKPIIELE